MYAADIKISNKAEFYVFARIMQRIDVRWSSGRTFTANAREWNIYQNRTWFTFKELTNHSLCLYYGNGNATDKILSLSQIHALQSKEELIRLIHSL